MVAEAQARVRAWLAGHGGQILALGVAAMWTVGVLVWPGLSLNDTDSGRGWQNGTDNTIAVIVVLLLTIGLVAFQMLSPFSSRALRLIVDHWLGRSAPRRAAEHVRFHPVSLAHE